MYILIYIYVYLFCLIFLFVSLQESLLQSKYSIALEYIKCLVKHSQVNVQPCAHSGSTFPENIGFTRLPSLFFSLLSDI